MLGGLHIEMTDWEALGKWLASSGWTAALVQADIAAPGTSCRIRSDRQTVLPVADNWIDEDAPGKADAFSKPSHVSETRHLHQATAAALYTLLQKAYSSYVEEHNDHAGNFDEWGQLKEDENPQLKFWSLTLGIQLSFLVCRQIIKRRGLSPVHPGTAEDSSFDVRT